MVAATNTSVASTVFCSPSNNILSFPVINYKVNTSFVFQSNVFPHVEPCGFCGTFVIPNPNNIHSLGLKGISLNLFFNSPEYGHFSPYFSHKVHEIFGPPLKKSPSFTVCTQPVVTISTCVSCVYILT